MTEVIYLLSILFVLYVIDEIEGVRFVVFLRDEWHINLVPLHQKYRIFRDFFIRLISGILLPVKKLFI